MTSRVQNEVWDAKEWRRRNGREPVEPQAGPLPAFDAPGRLIKRFDIIPVPKPRMTRRDKWKSPPRPCVARYRAYCDFLAVQRQGFEMPDRFHVVFYLPLPTSWSKAERNRHLGQPHQQRPDKDNLEKALLDALLVEDKTVWDGRVTKIWAGRGAIEIYTL